MKPSLAILLFAGILLQNTVNAQILEWAGRTGATQQDQSLAVMSDDAGNVYTFGGFKTTVDFDPGPGVYNLTSADGKYLQKLDRNGNFVWAKAFQLPLAGVSVLDGSIGADGNLYVVGRFSGTYDFDPGPGVYNMTSNPSYANVYQLKIRPDGSFAWARAIIGGDSYAWAIVVDTAGNVYTAGRFATTSDFDPGAGTHMLTSGAVNSGAYLQKLDSSGNFLWAYAYQGGWGHDVKAMKMRQDGNLVLTGEFATSTYGAMDLDLGPGVYALSGPPSGANNSYITCVGPDGTLVWAKSVYSTTSNLSSELAISATGSIWVTGRFNGTIDFDPGPGVFNLTAPVSTYWDIIQLKLDANGNFMHAHKYGNPALSEVIPMTVADPAGNLYNYASFTTTLDVDPGPAVFTLTSKGYSDAYMAKLDSNGAFIWGESWGGTLNDIVSSLTIVAPDTVWVGGSFNSTVDFDPSAASYPLTSAGAYDAFIAKFSQNPCSTFTSFIDTVANVTCGDSGFASVSAVGGATPYSYMWSGVASTDSVCLFPDSGFYSVTISDAAGCAHTREILVNSPAYLAGPDFVALGGPGRLTAGDTVRILAGVLNDGCLPAGGTLELIATDLHSIVHFTGGTPMPSYVSGDTIRWVIPPMVYGSPPLLCYAHEAVAPSAAIGTTALYRCEASAAPGEVLLSNNVQHYSAIVAGPFDPNHKTVVPEGKCEDHFTERDQALFYTINFQNTGTAEAENVFVLDTLDPDLDLSTVSVKASSHYMYTELLPGNVLKFMFPAIHLPDSGADEPGSHGYVLFQISHLASVPSGTAIHNGSAIYFDYNPPVITNVVLNTIVDSMPAAYLLYDSVAVCMGSSHTFPDGSVASSVIAPTSHISTLPSAEGCDSVIVTTLSIRPTYSHSESHSICAGDSYTFPDGTTLSGIVAPVVHASLLVSVAGCDSTVSTSISLLPNYSQTESALICEGGSYTFPDGTSLTGILAPVTHTSTFTSVLGCDSTINTSISLLPNYSQTESVLICEGGSYTFPDGTSLTGILAPVTHTSSLSSAAGCDSTIITSLSIIAVDVTVTPLGDSLEVAPGATYQWLDCNAAYAPVAGAISPIFAPSSDGLYAVAVTKFGCTDTSACYAVVISASVGAASPRVSLYPNPAELLVHIQSSAALSNVTLKLLDAKGRLLQDQFIPYFSQETIDISHLPAGMYFLSVIADEKVFMLKLMKE